MLQRLTERLAVSNDYEDNEDIYDEEYYDEEDSAPVGEITSLRSLKDAKDSEALSRIVTVWPKSFEDIQDFADPFRGGVPVILNLAYAEESARGRIGDFAMGMCYALRGTFNKISTEVFLMTPQNVKMEDSRSTREHF